MLEKAGTAATVVLAAICLSAAINNHYSLPSQLRSLDGESRRIRNSLSEFTEQALSPPFHDAEAIAIKQIAAVDAEIARAEADSLLLQSKLLEILATLSPEEQADVPQKIKDILTHVTVLPKDAALALAPELDAAKAHQRTTLYNSTDAPAAGAEARAAAAQKAAAAQQAEILKTQPFTQFAMGM